MHKDCNQVQKHRNAEAHKLVEESLDKAWLAAYPEAEELLEASAVVPDNSPEVAVHVQELPE